MQLYSSFYDYTSMLTFLKIELSAEQLLSMLSNLAYTKTKSIEINNIDKLNKKHIHKSFTFTISKKEYLQSNKDWKELAKEKALKLCPEGWKPDLHFNSKDSIVWGEDDGRIVTTIIRKWSNKPQLKTKERS